MANGNELSFKLFREHSDTGEKLLRCFAPSLLYRLTIDPQECDESFSHCEIRVLHLKRPGTDVEQEIQLCCDWSSWEEMGIADPQLCGIMEEERITEFAAIGMMALLVVKLEQLTIEVVLPRGTGADYQLKASSQEERFPIEVSGLRVARYPSDSSGRLNEKRERLLENNPCGYVSVITFSHPPDESVHCYLHFVKRSQRSRELGRETIMATNPQTTPEHEASILSMEGETALFSADSVLAREKHSKSAEILKKHANGARTSTDRHMRRFLAATQYYKAGLYNSALKMARRVEARFLSEYDKQLFLTFRNQVRQRVKPGYFENVRSRVAECQKRHEFRKIAALVWNHPYAYERTTLAFIRAYTSVQLKQYSAAGTFAAAAHQFGLSNPSKVIELAFLPCAAELSVGLEEGWLAARSFTKYFPHALSYLVASSILYRLANSTKGESRREWASKQVEYYKKAINSYNNYQIEFQNDADAQLFVSISSATAAIAYSWLGDLANASASLDLAENMKIGQRTYRKLLSDIRDFIQSPKGQDLLNSEPPAIPFEVITDEMKSRPLLAWVNQFSKTAA